MILPIYEDACLKTLNCFAMPLSVIQASDDFSYNFAFYKMLSIYSKNKNILLKDENSLLVPHCFPFVFWRALHFRVHLLHNEKNIKNIIIRSLYKKKYVYMGVNEEFIPERAAYKKAYHYHELLIYGYDEVTNKFYTIAFNENLSYKTQLIDEKDIVNAYKTNKLRAFSVYNIWLRKNIDLSHLNRILIKIKIYFYFHPIKHNYGYKSYDCFCQQLKNDYLRKTLDIRSFRTIYDRAKILTQTPFITQNLPSNINDLINENLLKSKILLKNAIKYLLTANPRIEQLLINDIKKFAVNEREILNAIFAKSRNFVVIFIGRHS